MSSPTYVSGSCNIGKGEIRRRQMLALIGAVLTAITIIGFISTNASPLARVSVFVPLAVTSIGWVQSRKKFCLAYGFMGTFNFGKLGELSRIASPVERKADRKVALSILIQSLLLAAALTAVVVALPLP